MYFSYATEQGKNDDCKGLNALLNAKCRGNPLTPKAKDLNNNCKYGFKVAPQAGAPPVCYPEPICPAGQKGKKNPVALQPPICVPHDQSDNDDRDEDRKKTMPERIAACRSRITAHIARTNASAGIPPATKAKIIAKLNSMLVKCNTPRGLEDEEKDKQHRSAEARISAIEDIINQILTLLRSLFPQAAVPKNLNT